MTKSKFNFYYAGIQHKSADDLIISLNGNLLRSYYNDKSDIGKLIELKKEGKWQGKLLVDSGAFTSWTKGVSICPDEYIDWINENSEFVDYFIQLDTIPGSPEHPPTMEQAKQATEDSWKNYLYMLEKVNCPFKILPVFHKREPISFLKQMVEHKINGKPVEYICFGGLARIRNLAESERWYLDCFDAIQHSSNPNVKVHNLGCADSDILEKYPFYSSDATSWLFKSSVGAILTDYGTVFISNQVEKEFKHIENRPPEVIQHVLQDCEKWGINFEDLKETYKARSLYNVRYLQRWADNYEYKGQKSFKRRRLF